MIEEKSLLGKTRWPTPVDAPFCTCTRTIRSERRPLAALTDRREASEKMRHLLARGRDRGGCCRSTSVLSLMTPSMLLVACCVLSLSRGAAVVDSQREFGVAECGACSADSDCMSYAYRCMTRKCVRKFGHSFLSVARCFQSKPTHVCAPCRGRVVTIAGWRVIRSTCKNATENCFRGRCVTPETMHLCFPA